MHKPGVPAGSTTRVPAVQTRMIALPSRQRRASSGVRTRTPNPWTKTRCVANYTIPESARTRTSRSDARAARLTTHRPIQAQGLAALPCTGVVGQRGRDASRPLPHHTHLARGLPGGGTRTPSREQLTGSDPVSVTPDPRAARGCVLTVLMSGGYRAGPGTEEIRPQIARCGTRGSSPTVGSRCGRGSLVDPQRSSTVPYTYPQRDSNPCYGCERPASWAAGR